MATNRTKLETHEEHLHVTIAVVIGIVLVLGFAVSLNTNATPAAPSQGSAMQYQETSAPVGMPAAHVIPPPSSQTTPVAAAMDAVHIAKDADGYYLTDANGRPLYTTTKSSCTADCLAKWPPYLVEPQNLGLAGRLASIARADTGDAQYAWNGKLLYYYSGDSGSSVTGDGVGGVWQVAKP